jgi:hypothetical protein
MRAITTAIHTAMLHLASVAAAVTAAAAAAAAKLKHYQAL